MLPLMTLKRLFFILLLATGTMWSSAAFVAFSGRVPWTCRQRALSITHYGSFTKRGRVSRIALYQQFSGKSNDDLSRAVTSLVETVVGRASHTLEQTKAAAGKGVGYTEECETNKESQSVFNQRKWTSEGKAAIPDFLDEKNPRSAETLLATRNVVGGLLEVKQTSLSFRPSVDSLLGAALDRSKCTVSTAAAAVSDATNRTRPSSPESLINTPYLGNPAISPTALAHSQWSHIIRPNTDTVIDATCGNGNDSKALAMMLFSSASPTDNAAETAIAPSITPTGNSSAPPKPQLLCVDIQERACQATRQRLEGCLSPAILQECVDIVQGSHAPLPRPIDGSSVGLVCYNLGYLPNSFQKKLYSQMETTIQSIADAAVLVRVGGMVSVTTYPRTNRNEDYAVRALLEGMALLTSKEVDWRHYLDEVGPDIAEMSRLEEGDETSYRVREAVRNGLERIHDQGAPKQTWRVLESKMLGRALAPIVLTATRVK